VEQIHSIVYKTRRKECERIKNYIDDLARGGRTSIAITGDRWMGKTALLKWVENEYRNNSSFLPVYINAGEVANPFHFVTTFSKIVNMHSDLHINSQMFNSWVDMLETLIIRLTDMNFYIILMVDEIQSTAFYKSSILEALRNIYQENKRLYLLFSVNKENKDILARYDKAFFASFFMLPLNSLDNNGRRLIIENMDYASNSKFINEVSWISDGNPGILNLAISMLYKQYDDPNKQFGVSLLKDTLKKLIEPQLSPQLRAVLKEFAINKKTNIATVANSLSLDPGSVANQLNRLIKKGFVEKGLRAQYRVKNYVDFMYSCASGDGRPSPLA